MTPHPRNRPELVMGHAAFVPHRDGPALSVEDLRLLIKTLHAREMAQRRKRRRK
jgi:hypothetical protein